MTSVKFIITPARFVTQFVTAEVKIMVSHSTKIIRVYEANILFVVV